MDDVPTASSRQQRSEADGKGTQGITGGGLTWEQCNERVQPRGREVEARQSENRRGTQTAARNGRPDGEAPTPAIQRRGRATKRRWDNGRKAGAKTHKQRRRQLEAERRRAGSKERPTSAKHTKKTRGSRQQAATRRGGSRSRMRTTPKKRDRGTPGTTSLGWRQGHTQNHHRWDGDGDIPRVIVAGMAAGAQDT